MSTFTFTLYNLHGLIVILVRWRLMKACFALSVPAAKGEGLLVFGINTALKDICLY